MWTAIKQVLSLELNPLEYRNQGGLVLGLNIWGVFENKTNATSYPNIGSFMTAIEEEWNKLFEEFILKVCKLFRKRVDTMIEKMVAILSKFTVLCLSSYFIVYVLN